MHHIINAIVGLACFLFLPIKTNAISNLKRSEKQIKNQRDNEVLSIFQLLYHDAKIMQKMKRIDSESAQDVINKDSDETLNDFVSYKELGKKFGEGAKRIFVRYVLGLKIETSDTILQQIGKYLMCALRIVLAVGTVCFVYSIIFD